jgi:hypothetical protein
MVIADERGMALNANIDIGDGHIILHSRSGSGPTARNPDYKEAFLVILSRLRTAGLQPDIFLDSAPVQSQPLGQRQVWRSDESGSAEQAFSKVVQRMNGFPGSVSRGAWRRLLWKVPGRSADSLKSIIAGRKR